MEGVPVLKEMYLLYQTLFSLFAVFISYSFVMSDTLCPLYKVSLTKNHLPLESNTGIGDMLQLKPLSLKETDLGDKQHFKPQGVQQVPTRPIGRGRGILCLNAEDIRKPH